MTTYLHTKLRVHRLNRAIAFYERHFGYGLRKRKPGPGTSELAFLSQHDAANELQLASTEEGPFEVPPLLMHLAFKVENLDRTLRGLVAEGIWPHSGPRTLESGSKVALIDLDGYELELIRKKCSAGAIESCALFQRTKISSRRNSRTAITVNTASSASAATSMITTPW